MGKGPTYKVKWRRRRKGRTDYYARQKMIRSENPRVVIRKTSRRMIVHFSLAKLKGDETISYTTSSELTDYGWEYCTSNLPAAYLTGYLSGLKAKEKGLTEAIPDFGYQENTEGNKLNATVKGLVDAGIQVPHSSFVLPEESRLKGEHIAKIASEVKKGSKTDRTQFKRYLKREVDPAKISAVFSQTLAKIAEKYEETPPEL